MNMLAPLVLTTLINIGLAAPKCGFDSQVHQQTYGWCIHEGSRLYIGRINSDGYTDLLCHDTTGNKWIAYGKKDLNYKNDWHLAMGWCYHHGAEVFTGDFNKDGKTDMLCHDLAGNKWIAYANSRGHYKLHDWHHSMGWCYHFGSELFVGDFNGDGRSDLLCHDGNNGDKFVALANKYGKFTSTSWHSSVEYCYMTGAQLLIGDVNADGRDDLVCRESNGDICFRHANTEGQFPDVSYVRGAWCAGNRLLLADVDGDKRKDLICHHKATGKIQVFVNKPGRIPIQTDWTGEFGFCKSQGSKILVADFNRDGKDDLLCHDKKAGKFTIALANC